MIHPAISALRGKEQHIHAAEGYTEHRLTDETLAKLSKIKYPSSAEFSTDAKVLKELAEHHVEGEEKNI